MRMYLKKVGLKNYGPLKSIAVDFRLDENQNPVSTLFVGVNGAGKTTLISVILDAIIEAKRKSFSTIQETPPNKFIKISSAQHITNGQTFLHGKVTFSEQNNELHFNEVVTSSVPETFMNENPELCAENPMLRQDTQFVGGGFHKLVQPNAEQIKSIKTLPIIYFPTFRYEKPHWLSDEAKVSLLPKGVFYGEAPNHIVSVTAQDEIREWITNVLLDRELYEKQSLDFAVFGIKPEAVGGFTSFLSGYSGPNTTSFNMMNSILTSIFKTNDPMVASARLGFGPKGRRSISVYVSRDGPEELVAHDLSHLSSGQLMAFVLSAQILKQYESCRGVLPTNISAVDGIVVIDEIDQSFHLSAQKELLPAILRSFPKIQFIVSTHSPLFALGMRDSGNVDVISLPEGRSIALEQYDEYRKAHQTFLGMNGVYLENYLKFEKELKAAKKAKLFTEGKTDWKHVRLALTKIEFNGKVKIDLEFPIDDSALTGDSGLLQMCKEFCKTGQPHKVIFLFDRDNPKIVKEVNDTDKRFKSWGNNVFSLCVEPPMFRKSHGGISIEHLYTDKDLRTAHPSTGRRLYFSNEIDEKLNPTTKKLSRHALAVPRLEEKDQAFVYDQNIDEIFDADGKLVALSKSAFFETVANNIELAKDFDFSGFQPTLEIIKEILEQ